MNVGVVVNIISILLGILGGSGGLFAFIISMKQHGLREEKQSSGEWQTLYEEVRDQYRSQLSTNKILQDEVFKLKTELNKLNLEINSYKHYDSFILEQEGYISALLSVIEPIVSPDIFNSLCNRKPSRSTALTVKHAAVAVDTKDVNTNAN